MSINATLLGQMIVFAFFVWFTMRFIWPPVTKALEDRRNKIADGLAAAERGQKELHLAQEKATHLLHQAKTTANQIIEQANQRASHVIDEARTSAKAEGDRLLNLAQTEIDKEVEQARQSLRNQVGTLVIQGVERLLSKQVDEKSNRELVDKWLTEI